MIDLSQALRPQIHIESERVTGTETDTYRSIQMGNIRDVDEIKHKHTFYSYFVKNK